MEDVGFYEMVHTISMDNDFCSRYTWTDVFAVSESYLSHLPTIAV